MKLTDGQRDALRNLARKKAGLDVAWIVIGDARELTELGFAARTRNGWRITAAGAALLAHQDPSGAEPRPAGQLVSGAWPARARRAGADEAPTLHGA